jgi:hypothetical protein
MTENPTTIRMALLARGHRPLPLMGKAVYLDGWRTKQIDRAEIEAWATNPKWRRWRNSGIDTAKSPAFDTDIAIEEPANAIEALIRKRLEAKGVILVRIGRWPKRTVLFRTRVPFKKIRVTFRAPDGSKQAIEMLASGQQTAAHGIHPGTGKPFEWHGGTPWEVPRNRLPLITDKQARQLVDDATKLLVEFGFEIIKKSGRRRSEALSTAIPDYVQSADFGRGLSQDPADNFGPPTIEDVMRALRAVDADDYDIWFEIGVALYNEFGEDLGYEIWDAWSATGQKYPGPYKTKSKWTDYIVTSGFKYGAGTIFHHANELSPGWWCDA